MADTSPETQAESSRTTSALHRYRDSSKFFAEILIRIAVFGDFFAFFAGLVGAFFVRFRLPPLSHLKVGNDVITLWNYKGHFILGALLFSVLAMRSGLYLQENILKLRRVGIALMNAAAYWTLVYLFISLLFYFHPPVSRLYVILGTVCGTVFVFIWRYLFNAFLLQERIAVKIRQRVLIVGWNLEAEKMAASILHDARHPYEIFGCLPSANNEYRIEPPPHVKRLGDYNSIQELLKINKVDIVLIADLDPKTREIISLCEFCNREMISFKVIPTYFQILLSGLHLETISGVPVLGVARLPLDSMANRAIKRTIDIVGALVGLILTVPLLAVFGTMVYLESPGSIIYRQVRQGRKGQPFTIYKIRSMKLDAEPDGPQWTKQNDARCLRVGAFMRKWNLDEFPQFWNVLKGEMSLVGPRPERPELIEDFVDQIRHYNARHHIKPGLTGWAQINGLRGDTDLNERIRYDLYYLENWSPMLDFYIMLRTFSKNQQA